MESSQRRMDPLDLTSLEQFDHSQWVRAERKKRLHQAFTIVSPIIILFIWEICARFGWIDARFFPPPTKIGFTLWQMFIEGTLFEHIGISLLRILGGFLLGAIPAMILGLMMGMYKTMRYLFSPLIMALMPIPTLALLPMIIIIFDIGELSKMVTIAGSVFFPIVINTAAGVSNIDKVYLDVAKNYGASPRKFFFTIALPGSLPFMMEGIQMGQAIALLTIVAAEMMNAQSGIGYLIWSSYKTFTLTEMYVGLILISFFGYTFSLMLRGLERWLIPWKQ